MINIGSLPQASGGGKYKIKSVQTGWNGTSNQTYTKTISAIDPSKSFVICRTTHFGSRKGSRELLFRGKIQDATTLYFERNSNSSDTIMFTWMVVEFEEVKSIQWFDADGINAFGPTYKDYTISAVDKNKSFVVFDAKSTTSGYNWFPNHNAGCRLVSNTAVRFDQQANQTVTLKAWVTVVELG